MGPRCLIYPNLSLSSKSTLINLRTRFIGSGLVAHLLTSSSARLILFKVNRLNRLINPIYFVLYAEENLYYIAGLECKGPLFISGHVLFSQIVDGLKEVELGEA